MSKPGLKLILILSPIIFAVAETRAQEFPVHSGTWVSDTIVSSGSQKFTVPVWIYIPRGEPVPDDGYPLLIALHGWNLRAEEWQNSGIDRIADRFGILIVCPQMGKANYEREYFPETKMKWNPVPSGVWIKESLLTHIEKEYPISRKREKRGVIGVSTGGHGALLLAGYYPEIFGFAAMISGDFDVSETPEDGLAKASFGPYEKFRERWKANSAIAFMDRYRDTKVYAAHGSADRVAPVSQSRLLDTIFKETKEKLPDGYAYVYNETPNAGHDWNFWKSQLEPALIFFMGDE
jgi:hypothetical protein